MQDAKLMLMPCWPYLWSLRPPLKVGPAGRVPVGTQRLRVAVSPGTRVVHCQPPNGDLTLLAASVPNPNEKPAVLLKVRAA